MCKHQLREQFLAKKAEAELINSLPDASDFERVTGCKVEDFGTPEGIKSAYQLGMTCLFQRNDPFAIRCMSLFPNLFTPQSNLTETIQSN